MEPGIHASIPSSCSKQPKDNIFSTQVNTVQAKRLGNACQNTQLFLEDSERHATIWCKKEHFTI